MLIIIPVCEIPCHQWIHANPNKAMESGLLHPEYRHENKSKGPLARQEEIQEGKGPDDGAQAGDGRR